VAECCQKKSRELEKLNQQSRVLWVVLAVNAGMFVVELLSGLRSSSLSLAGDSLDMLGDAIAYGSSLYVINRGRKSLAKSALLRHDYVFICCNSIRKGNLSGVFKYNSRVSGYERGRYPGPQCQRVLSFTVS